MATIRETPKHRKAGDLWPRLKTALHRPDTPLPNDVREWLLEAARCYDGSEALDKLLGLRGAGVRTLSTRQAIQRRDVNLWIAWHEHSHGGDPTCSRHERNRIFVERVRRFERRFPRINQGSALDAFERHLLDACRAHPLPSNDRYLLEIVSR